jgi:hypothetical protein
MHRVPPRRPAALSASRRQIKHIRRGERLLDRGDLGCRRMVDRPHTGAGFDRLVLQNAGPDPDSVFDFYRRELAQPLRQLAA